MPLCYLIISQIFVFHYMRRLVLIGIVALCTLMVRAQIAEIWVSMPDSVCPYLNAQQRKQMFDRAMNGVFVPTVNQLNGTSLIEAVDLPGNTLRVRYSQVQVTEIQAGNDTIVIIDHVCAPVCSTLTRRYNYAWMLLSAERSKWDAELTDEEKEQLF